MAEACNKITMLRFMDEDVATARGNMKVAQGIVRRRCHQVLHFGAMSYLDTRQYRSLDMTVIPGVSSAG